MMDGIRNDPNAEAELNEELWKDPGFYRTELPVVLAEFSKGLRRAFWGMIAYFAGVGGFLFSLAFPGSVTLWPFLLLAGYLLTMSSKSRCSNFAAPITGQKLVRWSYYLDWAAILVRILRRVLPSLIVLLVSSGCAFASALCFVLFLSRLNQIISRPRLRALAHIVFGCWILVLVLFGVCLFPRPVPLIQMLFDDNIIGLIVMTVAGVFGIASMFGYTLLLWSTARGLKSMSDFLIAERHVNDYDDVNGEKGAIRGASFQSE
jgi:lysylphosphatidylglycerol synthetase-like protein (DUF2156 family)